MREKSDPMLPYHCYGLDHFCHEYEALARVDTDGCWYKRDEVDAELAALREEVEDQAGLIKRLSDLLNSAVNVLRGPPPDDTLWSFHDVAERAEALRARVAVLQAGHDRYEWLRRQNLATVNVLWRQAMIGGNRFDDLVDELRATESAGDGL